MRGGEREQLPDHFDQIASVQAAAGYLIVSGVSRPPALAWSSSSIFTWASELSCREEGPLSPPACRAED